MAIRSKFNGTGRPVEFKTWAVRIDAVKPSHFPIITSHKIYSRALIDVETIDSYHIGKTVKYGKGGRAEFETTKKEQEVILKLLYGSDLILMMTEVVLPNTYTECTLGNYDS